MIRARIAPAGAPGVEIFASSFEAAKVTRNPRVRRGALRRRFPVKRVNDVARSALACPLPLVA